MFANLTPNSCRVLKLTATNKRATMVISLISLSMRDFDSAVFDGSVHREHQTSRMKHSKQPNIVSHSKKDRRPTPRKLGAVPGQLPVSFQNVLVQSVDGHG